MQRYREACRRELSAFMSALSGVDVSIPDGSDGIKVLVLADAADRSAGSRDVVQLA